MVLPESALARRLPMGVAPSQPRRPTLATALLSAGLGGIVLGWLLASTYAGLPLMVFGAVVCVVSCAFRATWRARGVSMAIMIGAFVAVPLAINAGAWIERGFDDPESGSISTPAPPTR